VFHAPHDGQRPNQRASSLPHALQKKWDFSVFAVFVTFGIRTPRT
jgi:hypothetical protein